MMAVSILSLCCILHIVLGQPVPGLDEDYMPIGDMSKSSFYFGSEESKGLNGRELADSYPDGSCNVQHFACLNNAANLLEHFATLTPYDCCKSCLNNTKCKAWNHYYINATNGTEYQVNDHPMCHLFSTFPNDTDHVFEGNCVIGTPYDESKQGKRPNYIFFFPDTIRMESMSLYDYPLPSTPNLKKFAQSGAKFNNHITQHSQCSPSRNAMISGRYMHNLGHRTQAHLIQTWEPNYFRWLKDSGYYVLWLGKNDALSKNSFPLSVNEWKNVIGVQHGSNPYPYPQPGYYSFLFNGSNIYGNNTKNGDYQAVLDAKNFLNSNPPEPFFIFIPGIGAHPPYGAPIDYQNKFNISEIKAKAPPLRPPSTPNKPKYHSNTIGIQYWRNLTSFDDDFFYQINSIYVGMVNYMDWIFGQLVDAVDDFDKKTNTTTGLIMSSDHGDFGGDYHLVEKWPGGGDDVLLRIPLVMRMPGGKQNVNITMPSANFDILATMLDLANINIEFNSFGMSLKEQVIDGKEGDLNRYVYSEGGFSNNNEVFPGGSDHITNEKNLYWPRAEEEMSDNGHGSPRWVCLRNAYWKMVFRAIGVSELYDLEKDPRQLNNLFTSTDEKYVSIRDQLVTNLTAWFVQTADVTPILMDPRGLPKQVAN